MILEDIIDAASKFADENLAAAIAIGLVFFLFLLKKPKYFLIVVLVLAAGIAVFDLFQKLAVKTGMAGF